MKISEERIKEVRKQIEGVKLEDVYLFEDDKPVVRSHMISFLVLPKRLVSMEAQRERRIVKTIEQPNVPPFLVTDKTNSKKPSSKLMELFSTSYSKLVETDQTALVGGPKQTISTSVILPSF